MKLTEWFEPGVQPTIPGVYQTFDEETYQHWDGDRWGYCSTHPANAMSAGHYGPGSFQEPKWRGLAEKP